MRSPALGVRNLMALAVACVAIACENVVVSTVDVSAVRVSPDEISLVVNATEQLVAVPMSAAGTPMPAHSITWASSDPQVATVDDDGTVRALGPGATRISATSGGVVGEAVVTVSSGPRLVATPSHVELEGVEGDAEGESVEVAVRQEEGGPAGLLSVRLEYPAAGPQGWLSAEASSQTAPTTIRLEARPAGLESGTYSATARVSSSSPEVASAVIQVDLVAHERVVPEPPDPPDPEPPQPSEPSPRESTVTAEPKRLPANGTASSLIVVTLRNALGTLIPTGGHEVVLSTTRGTLGDVTDHGNGTYSARLTSESDGEARVSATVDGVRIEQRANVRFEEVD